VDGGNLRISDADREAAAQRLHTAMGEGRITLTELEERLGVVYAAKTFAELEPPLADLPGAGIAPVVAAPLARRDPVNLSTEMGSIKRTGDWPVPEQLRLTTSMGSIHLDLTENGQAAGNGEVRDGPSSRVTSARANDLASDHWRERASRPSFSTGSARIISSAAFAPACWKKAPCS